MNKEKAKLNKLVSKKNGKKYREKKYYSTYTVKNCAYLVLKYTS